MEVDKAISNSDIMNIVLKGLIRIHILHHACKEPVFGFWFIEELARHGYVLSPGTLYPLLHEMEKKRYLKSKRRRAAGRIRRVYKATQAGHSLLEEAKGQIRELFGELFDEG